MTLVSGPNLSLLFKGKNGVVQEDDSKKSISRPMKHFHNLERFPRHYFGYTKKFIICFETVVDVLATKHKNCRIILQADIQELKNRVIHFFLWFFSRDK